MKIVTMGWQPENEKAEEANQRETPVVTLGSEGIKPAKLEFAEHYAAMKKVQRRETEISNIKSRRS